MLSRRVYDSLVQELFAVAPQALSPRLELATAGLGHFKFRNSEERVLKQVVRACKIVTGVKTMQGEVRSGV